MSFKVTWLGHGSWAIEIDGYKGVLDPFLSGNPAASTDAGSVEADFILVTHGHGDHVSDVVPIAQRTGALVVCNADIAGWFRDKGVSNIHTQHLGGGYQHDFGHVKFTIAHHGSGLPDGSYGGNPAGMILTAKSGKKVYFAGDTALFMDMQLYAGCDLAILPIGDNFTMGPGDALKAVEFLKPKAVIPCHYNTWPLIQVDAEAWVDAVNSQTDTKAILLDPGGSYTIE